MNTISPAPSAAPVASPREIWCHEAAVTPARPPEWLWHGYLARGETTLLTSQWKTGKTTLVSVLLSKLSTGGKLGEQVLRPGKAAVVSEERLDHVCNAMQGNLQHIPPEQTAPL